MNNNFAGSRIFGSLMGGGTLSIISQMLVQLSVYPVVNTLKVTWVTLSQLYYAAIAKTVVTAHTFVQSVWGNERLIHVDKFNFLNSRTFLGSIKSFVFNCYYRLFSGTFIVSASKLGVYVAEKLHRKAISSNIVRATGYAMGYAGLISSALMVAASNWTSLLTDWTLSWVNCRGLSIRSQLGWQDYAIDVSKTTAYFLLANVLALLSFIPTAISFIDGGTITDKYFSFTGKIIRRGMPIIEVNEIRNGVNFEAMSYLRSKALQADRKTQQLKILNNVSDEGVNTMMDESMTKRATEQMNNAIQNTESAARDLANKTGQAVTYGGHAIADTAGQTIADLGAEKTVFGMSVNTAAEVFRYTIYATLAAAFAAACYYGWVWYSENYRNKSSEEETVLNA